MTAIHAADMPDVIQATLDDLGPMRFQQIYQQLPNYEMLGKWLKRDRVEFRSGVGISRTAMIQDADSVAEHKGLLDEDKVDIQDTNLTIKTDWVHADTHYAVVYQTDILMNSGRAMIHNVIETRRAKALIDLAQELEDKAWATPEAGNDTVPHSVLYWCVKNATQGFTGGAPSGFTTVGNINPETHDRWKNYSGTYQTEVTKEGAIKVLRTAKRQCNFKSPITIQDYRGSIGQRYRLYVNETTISQFEDIGEGQNESLGKDVASMDGTIVFRGHPVIWIPKLDAETDNPIYMLDHSVFYPTILRGDYLRESEAQRSPKQHNVYHVFVDLTYQILCVDRRRLAVIYKSN